MFSKHNFLLLTLLVIGIFLRFYDLMWGAPFYFHPDERNIIYAISQLSFPSQMNPHFFAYGSLPIYIVYFTSSFFAKILHLPNDFGFMVLWLRFFAALLSSLIIFSLYFISERLWNRQVGLLAAFLATFSVGFIQFAHFGTFEIWTTFFSIWLFYFSLLLIKVTSKKNVLLTGILMGILLAIKVSNLVLIIFPLICAGLFYIKSKQKNISAILLNLVVYAAVVGTVYAITNPFVLLDTKDFLSSINYESSVAIGTLPVFYTGSFFNTVPVVFQFLRVYPFLINPLLVLLFIPSFLWLFLQKSIQKNINSFLLIFFFLLLFSSQAFLFVKWTRYMLPTLGFIYIMIALWVTQFPLNIKQASMIGIAITSLIFTFSFVKTVYVSPDTRIAAADWAENHLSSVQPVVTEPYDLGIMPFNSIFPSIVQLPVYDIDQNPEALQTMQKSLSDASIFILPSQRLIHSRIINKTVFPQGGTFYTNLLADKTDYKKVYETPCDLFCKITYMGDPLFAVEETASVFDRPTVMIFTKQP